LKPGISATDVVLMITERLRAKGVIGKIVEFHGPGVGALSLPDRATISNMAPEYGATMGFFPVDAETLSYLAVTGRAEAGIALAEAYCRKQGLWRDEADDLVFSDEITLDLSAAEPSMAGPRRPQDRHAIGNISSSFTAAFTDVEPRHGGEKVHDPGRALQHGDVVIAAITSCTNTSHPGSMISAGLLARNAAARGLRSKPWVKTSLSPGSRVVTDYLREAGLIEPLESLGFYLAGYGCMTCAGGSGPLAPDVAQAIDRDNLVVTAMLSSNRNFEGRIHPQVRAAYIGSPALVVAFALAGSALVNLEKEPIGFDAAGQPLHLRDIWPDREEVQHLVDRFVSKDVFRRSYAAMFEGDEEWRALPFQAGDRFAWNEESDYLRRPPFFDEELITGTGSDIVGARILLMLGDSITTDHISPAGAISKTTPAGEYLISRGVQPREFHSYVARRGNHEVMARGTYANIRLKNEMTPNSEGGVAVHVPSGERHSVFDAAMRYRAEGIPLVVVAGAEYGTGSSRDWAAKGVRLLGVRAVIAESFERIHRSNLVGMGVLPLQLPEGVTRKTLGLTGRETVDVSGLGESLRPGTPVNCTIRREDGSVITIALRCRLDTLRDVEWYMDGGVLPHVARKLVRAH
jgi:aconitate hydratase